jgi:hypothetical protein
VPALDPAALAAAGFRTGLTAAIGTWADDAGVTLPPPWAGWVADQRAEVAARHARFAEARSRVLVTLAEAGVAAVPVKGAVLSEASAGSGWPRGEARPMADLDLLVAPGDRPAARRALEAAGFPLMTSEPWEDTFLAWPGDEPLRLDGESAGHPGTIEIHPGWVERFHDYLVDDGGLVTGRARPGTLAGAPCHRLDPVGLAAHVVGHLAACVVRADARALHVVDSIVVLRALDPAQRAELAALWARLDPRLSAPAAWLVAAYRPDSVDATTLAASLGRLGPAARRQLAATEPAAVLRGGRARTTFAWRRAFARSFGERVHVARQLMAPASGDLSGAGNPAARHARRVVRAARRLAGPTP